jgi:cytochrome c biogenesis protein CcmG/thiol:disulfide interchange protein DsbE
MRNSLIGAGWMLVFALALGAPAHSVTAPVAGDAPVLAADFERTTMDGAPVSLARWRGKVVLLNFWATWCAPCLIEMPRFSAWQQQYGSQGLQIVGISMDDSAGPVKRLLSQRPVSYPVIMGDTKLAQLYGGIYGLPSTFVIDPKGHIVARYRGEVDLKQLESLLKSLLPKPTL